MSRLDKLMVLANGQVQGFGPKDEVLRKTVQNSANSPAAAARLKVVGDGQQEGG